MSTPSQNVGVLGLLDETIGQLRKDLDEAVSLLRDWRDNNPRDNMAYALETDQFIERIDR